MIISAWQYADRVIVAGREQKEPPLEPLRQKIITLGLIRISELIAATQNNFPFRYVFRLLAELEKLDGILPRSKYRNPAPAPPGVTDANLDMVLAAQTAMFAFITEELLGVSHPMPVLFRQIEREPQSWQFDETEDMKSAETLCLALAGRLSGGFDNSVSDYVKRWNRV